MSSRRNHFSQFATIAGLLCALTLACSSSSGSDGGPRPEQTQIATAPAGPPGTQPTAAAGGAPAGDAGPRWQTRAPLPEANSEIAVAELNGKIYVIGGYPSSRVVAATVQVYDSATDSWSLTAPLPLPLHHTMAASANGKLYVVGGEAAGSGATLGNAPAGGAGFVDFVFEYDPAVATWTRKASMPTARSGGAAAVIDGKIYVAGGRPPRGSDFAVYDPAADRWTVLPPLPTQRNHLAAAAIGGKVYVAGGRFGGGVGSEMTGALEVYDPATNRWERKASLPSPRAGVNGITAQGCLYVFGGEGNDADPRGIFAELEVYSPAEDRWQKLEPIPTPVHGVTGAAVIDGWIHLPGGGTSRGGSSGSTLHQVFRVDETC
jgi:N-acetylneuraminic acid mutarotase